MTARALAGTALVLAAAVLIAAAVVYPGFRSVSAELNDGGVWVTNSSLNMVGHLNFSSKVLDGGVAARSADFDVVQEGRSVAVQDRGVGTLSPVDAAEVRLTADLSFGGTGTTAFGTTTAALADPGRGRLWALGLSGLSGFNPETTEPTVQDVPGIVATVTSANEVVGISAARSEIVRVPESGQPEFATVEGLPTTAKPQLTTVGSDAVVLDPAAGTLYLPGGARVTREDLRGARLQESGPEAGAVAVGTAEGLLLQPLGGGEPRVLEAAGGRSGVPAAPVQQGGCVHGAWAGTSVYLRVCGDAGPEAKEIPSARADSELVFRTNRDLVVLNDVRGGNVWLVTDQMQLVDNWQEIVPQKQTKTGDQEDSAEIMLQKELPDRSEENEPPTAAADDFGVRPGRTVILPVLLNDTDPDGDVLTVRALGDPRVGQVQPIFNGAALQVVVAAGASGAESFEYEVSDGRGGTATARVNLSVKESTANSAPRQVRVNTIAAEQGTTVSQNILGDFVDPDGDELFLAGAATAGDGDSARFQADGTVIFQDGGKSVGKKELTVRVSDGRETTEATIAVDVRPRGTLPPQTTPDHVRTGVGEPIVVSPLVNDVDPSGTGLRLLKVEPVAGLDVVMNSEDGTFSAKAAEPKVYYAVYLASNGSATSQGLVRIDVEPSTEDTGAPIAVRDVGLLPAGGNVLVDPLANDTDPAGGVLVVQSVSLPSGAPVSVSIINHAVLRITDTQGLTEPLSIGYVVSNGDRTASSTVTVTPVPAPEKLEPPVAKNDQVVVRAGDTVTIPVLANDTHPNGAPISLDPDLVEVPDPAAGHLFVDQDRLRFSAGPTAGTVYGIYEVADPSGQKDSAKVTITVRAADPEQNAMPVPKNLTARVLAGHTAKVAVPLDGVDPDGDSVTVTGIEKAPERGTAIVRDGYLEYSAANNASGKDTFTYVVEDRFGGRGVATVLVGIAAVPNSNQKPLPGDDKVTVRPGRPVSVDVLANDTDPDGDTVRLVDGFEVPEGAEARVDAGRVVVTPPGAAGTVTVRYTVDDGRGARAVGSIVVEVTPDAELKAPIARDDRVNAMDVAGRTTFAVDVLANDEDPDGVAGSLSVTVPPSAVGAGTTVSGQTVNVALAQEAQVIPYTVRDADGLSATAILWVPGLKDQRPVLKTLAPVKATAGEPLELRLSDHVAVRPGRAPRITTEGSVSAIASDGSPLVKDAKTLVYTALREYGGLASVTFEVTDGAGPDDPEGLKSILTVPIDVQPTADKPNSAPTFATSVLEVAQREGEARLDLRAATRDPDPGDIDRMSYRLTSPAPAGIEVRLEGSVLTASAGSAAKGTAGQVSVEVDDGREKVTGAVTLRVVGSTRPLAVANPDSVPEAAAGEPVEIDVLANDANPFPDAPLAVLRASINGSGTARVEGDRVVVTPAAGFHGQLTGSYRVQDATGDGDREVEGTFTVTVQDAPDAPSAPVVDSMASRQVVLHWTPPANNGSEITGYKVLFNGGSQACPTNTCTVTGLANGTEYTFTVVAANRVGESAPSPASAPVTPDARPEQPAPPVLTRGDGKITLAWTAPANEGTPIKGYTLELSSAQGLETRTVGNVTKLVWEGLTNGVEYRARIQAANGAKDPSEWSELSAAAKPAGAPLAPAAPSATRTTSAVNGGVVDVTWASEPLKNNGEPVTSYDVHVYRNGTLAKTVTGVTGTSQQVTGLDSSSSYTFSLVSHNVVGPSPEGTQSNAVTPYGRPGAPTNLTAAPTNTRNAGEQVQLSFGQAADNGSAVTVYQYALNGGTWENLAADRIVRGLANGTAYSFAVRAVNSAGPGPASNADSARPYGQPKPPVVSASSDGIRVNMAWNTGGYDNGRNTVVTVTIDGSRTQNDGAQTVGDGPDQAHSIRVTACVEIEPTNCTSTSDSARTASASVNLQKGPKVPAKAGDSCYTNECFYFDVTARNFHPNRTVTVKCWNNGQGAHVFAQFTRQTDGNGYFRNTDNCFLGKSSLSGNLWTEQWVTASDGSVTVESNRVSW
ncbi:Ig-like domain-containing protein [Sinomonas halotolerans]|uniref:Ig-like domain-containing protein n=1 Tax=Sinomonas halotolerans TaxID=1644133 RepID=A0ABU9WY95_9MICC